VYGSRLATTSPLYYGRRGSWKIFDDASCSEQYYTVLRNNFTPEFLKLVDAEHFLFSSNGDRFEHPDAETVQAVIKGARRKPTLWFDYRSEFTRGLGSWLQGRTGEIQHTLSRSGPRRNHHHTLRWTIKISA
jgi:hypothetical protein